MAQWNGASESGILRKHIQPENYDDLLVFGYACKLFRDDEKALYIDQGKHLIPWMGDETLKIDRYDGRGALSDLSKYEASREGYDATRWLGLSEKERNVEELCDKERYYSLTMNEEEEQMYKEETIKRQKTNAIQYSYDVPQNPELKTEDIPTVAEADEEYVPPPILDVPIDIEKPKTVKENARIEKTALFVHRQGPQMEILIKAKQGDNSQFSFLNQDDKLYKFYRHVLAAFKNGRYQGYEAHTRVNNENQVDNVEPDSTSHYLHPSLVSSTSTAEPAASIAITIPQIPYKPSQNCSYSQLVNRIQGNQIETQEVQASNKLPDYTQMTIEQQQYYQYYYVQQYYEYYKQLALFQQGQGGNPGQFVPPTDFQNLDPSVQHYIQQMAYNQYVQHQQSNNSYAQIVSNVNNVATVPKTVVAPAKDDEEERTVTIVSNKVEVIIKKPLQSLAVYGSGSDSENTDIDEDKNDERIVTVVKPSYSIPTGETQIVINKMAIYVSKNGDKFEEILRAKNDPRFEFLKDGHEFNNYYKEKLRELKEENSKDCKKEEIKLDTNNDVKKPKKEKKIITPVSFSIKKPKEEQPKEIKSALPVEESSDEEETSTIITTTTATVTTTTSSLSTLPTNTIYSLAHNAPSYSSVVLKNSDCQKKIVSEDQTPTSKAQIPKLEDNKNENEAETAVLDEDPILEMIELTEEVEEKKDAKRAEDKIKDKLAAAAREKLASATRDRALQIERKKKAAAFLKLKSAETNQQSATPEQEKQMEKSSPLRRDSVEIIEIDSEDPSPKKRKHRKDRSRSRSRGRDRRRKKRDKDKDKDKERRRSISSGEEVEEDKKRRDDERREKRKRVHKRKRSKSKRKSKKRHKKSGSEGSDSEDSIL